jgi:hypothetical protein
MNVNEDLRVGDIVTVNMKELQSYSNMNELQPYSLIISHQFRASLEAQEGKGFRVKEIKDYGLKLDTCEPSLKDKTINARLLKRVTKYHVGDKVVVKDWHEMVDEFGVTLTDTGQYSIDILPYFTLQMKDIIPKEPFIIKEFKICYDNEGKLIVAIVAFVPELSGISYSKWQGFNTYNITDDMVRDYRLSRNYLIMDNSHIESDVCGNKITVSIEKNGIIKTGISRCCPEDKFDFKYGFALALDRAIEEMIIELNRIVWKKGTKIRIEDISTSVRLKNSVCIDEYIGKLATLDRDYDLSKTTTISDVKFDLEYMEAINKHNGKIAFSLKDIALIK